MSSADAVRFSSQLAAVREIMMDGARHSIPEIKLRLAADFGLMASETSVSARIRDLRKAEFGGYTITRDRQGRRGLWHYQMRGA